MEWKHELTLIKEKVPNTEFNKEDDTNSLLEMKEPVAIDFLKKRCFLMPTLLVKSTLLIEWFLSIAF